MSDGVLVLHERVRMMGIVRAHIGPIHAADIRWNRLTRVVQDPKDWMPQRMTSMELVEFVRAVVDGEIYIAQQVEPDGPEWDLGAVFPALSFLLEVSHEARLEIGTCYERLDRAIGRARHGRPTFSSVQFIHREDWLRARDMIAAEVIRRERLEQ